jgi:hypothetical protein
MIGKPEWFTYRIFGWGLRPKTWQGWVYVCAAALLMGFITAITLNDAVKVWIFGILFGSIILDMIHIMIQLDKVHDERENLHQLIIERNCSFAAIAALIGVALYQTYQNRMLLSTTIFPFDYSLLIVLGAMVAVKAISYAYVKYKM